MDADLSILPPDKELFTAPEPQLSQGLSKFFEALRSLPPDDKHIFEAVLALAIHVPDEPDGEPRPNRTALDPLAQACIRAGMTEVMLQFIHFPDEEFVEAYSLYYGYMNQWQAWNSLLRLARYGTIQEREQYLDKLMDGGIIPLAAEVLGVLASQTYLIKRLSSDTTADILRALYTLALQDPEATSDQLREPRTIFQQSMLRLDGNDPWNDDEHSRSLMSNRLFGQAQGAALETARSLIVLNTQPSSRHYLDVLRQKPSIIDLLMDCLLIKPLHCHPECTAAYAASDNLAALFRWPSSMLVPGISTPAEQVLGGKDWKALLQSLQLLTSHRDWTDNIIEAWMKTEPDVEDIEDMDRSIEDAHNLFSEERSQIDEEEIDEDFKTATGRARISLLRVVATLTHGADAAGVRNVDVYSLLPIAYRASQQERPFEEMIHEWPDWAELENSYELEIEHYFVAPESLLGPTAYTRLLTVLAQRNALKSLHSLQKPPAGLSPTTSAAQLRQITHPDVISRLLTIAIIRVQGAMRKAERVSEGDVPSIKIGAGLVFEAVAELAAAVVAFDDLTGGEYAAEAASAARHYLVLALQHISETATRARKYRRAYLYLVAAVEVGDSIKDRRAGWTDVEGKLKKQLRQAKRAFEAQANTDIDIRCDVFDGTP
ncbi:hypothetical protein CONPUDRAFT_78164 [Coniophora puteana RWD-64-598 SS2]|uniref:Uncharacterized protein n=1 Tax=Coniophora puteana (strain RWD-64-598) TaxID=741705 RepID=R7SEE3_CONPW|nr:uncharacterized protein CONPUDRAFT_78164 [Coniophora puteana RWD-64-598 SS2]EIW74195.1 hypothetical protein CONPUDRAFT_78164 [Coniophora puteana RWD-64-598 SS2]